MGWQKTNITGNGNVTTDDICVRIMYSEVTHFSRNLIDQEICKTLNPSFGLGFRVGLKTYPVQKYEIILKIPFYMYIVHT